mmetsp:Transcript_11778/g.31110  ORF Transcript_11778/g.31110 Transcript_11778/m.31110 type:complete len:382 (+) Transcript_11778:542-1687(+)
MLEALPVEQRPQVVRHEAVVAAVDEELHPAAFQQRPHTEDEALNVLLLGSGAAYRHQEPRGLLLLAALDARLAVGPRVQGDVSGHPMSRVLQRRGRDAHGQELGVVRGRLNQVVGPGNQDEVLRVVVDHQVDDGLDAAGHRNLPDPRVRSDQRDVLRQRLHERLQLLGEQAAESQRVDAARQHHLGPNFVHDATNVRGDAGRLGVHVVHRGHPLCLRAVDSQDVDEERVSAQFQGPSDGGVRDAVVPESHPHRPHDDRLPLQVRQGACRAGNGPREEPGVLRGHVDLHPREVRRGPRHQRDGAIWVHASCRPESHPHLHGRGGLVPAGGLQAEVARHHVRVRLVDERLSIVLGLSRAHQALALAGLRSHCSHSTLVPSEQS